MYPALYTAHVWDDIHGRIEEIKGITFAETFTEAMGYIEDYYGKELNDITLELQEESFVWELLKE